MQNELAGIEGGVGMPERIIAVVDDMFFAAKIRGTAEAVGVRVQFARSFDEVKAASEATPPALIIADLHSQRCDPFTLAAGLKADADLRAIPLLGFFSHVQTELQERARASGYDRVIPRSVFAKKLPQILKGDFEDTRTK